MLAVTCPACRVRFEASFEAVALRGAPGEGGAANGLRCPACDAGEPVVIDAARTPDASEDAIGEAVAAANRTASRKGSPRSILRRGAAETDASPIGGDASGTGRIKVTPPPLDMAQPEADEPQDEAPVATPVYVDLPAAAEPQGGGGAGAAWLAALALTVGAMLTLLPAAPDAVRAQIQAGTERARAVVQAAWSGAAEPSAFETAGLAPSTTVGDDFVTASVSSKNGARVLLDPAAGLDVAAVATELAQTDNGLELVVRATVRNGADGTRPVPRLRVSIRDGAGAVLHRWRTAEAQGEIETGESYVVEARTTRVPTGAADVKVDLVRSVR